MNKIVIGGISDSTEFVIGFGLLNLANKKYPSCFMFEFEDMLEPQYWVSRMENRPEKCGLELVCVGARAELTVWGLMKYLVLI